MAGWSAFLSRRRLVGSLVALTLLAAACTSPAAQGTSTPGPTSARSTDIDLVTENGALFADHPERLERVAVERVVDGDTLIVDSHGARVRVRVFGIAAPETTEPCGPEATEALRRLAGSQVLLLGDQRLEDEYGRSLRYIFTPDGASIDAALVTAGAVEAWHDDGAYRNQLRALESAARAAKRGCLWQTR